jgi:hypothetical protein
MEREEVVVMREWYPAARRGSHAASIVWQRYPDAHRAVTPAAPLGASGVAEAASRSGIGARRQAADVSRRSRLPGG